LLAGEGGFERYHAWLMETPAPLDDEALRRGARECGLDPAALLDALGQPSVRAVVEADVAAARALRVHSIPFLFVGGRRVPRWRVEGVELLEPLLREALESP
jgi:2-hydroxychromene-2-carboxylate isomerase